MRNFARSGANVVGVDLTHTAVNLTRESLRLFSLTAQLGVADAEKLPFLDNCFDFVTSNGVLHHTPDTERAFQEALRAPKPGHRALISVYYKHPLLRRPLFPLTRLMLRLGSLRAAGRTGLTTARTAEEFVRSYDGDRNPLGKAYDFAEPRRLSRGSEILNMEVHFFSRRFFPLGKYIPVWLHRQLNRHFGTLIYARLRKPAGGTN